MLGNLEEAKAGKPVCTRDGRKARIICFDFNGSYEGIEYPIIALVGSDKSEYGEELYYFTPKGCFRKEYESELDLMMVGEKKEGWINIYKGDLSTYSSNYIYDTKEAAADGSNTDKCYITTIKIEWEE